MLNHKKHLLTGVRKTKLCLAYPGKKFGRAHLFAHWQRNIYWWTATTSITVAGSHMPSLIADFKKWQGKRGGLALFSQMLRKMQAKSHSPEQWQGIELAKHQKVGEIFNKYSIQQGPGMWNITVLQSSDLVLILYPFTSAMSTTCFSAPLPPGSWLSSWTLQSGN